MRTRCCTDFTVDDPVIYTEPWGGEIPMWRQTEQMYEYALPRSQLRHVQHPAGRPLPGAPGGRRGVSDYGSSLVEEPCGHCPRFLPEPRAPRRAPRSRSMRPGRAVCRCRLSVPTRSRTAVMNDAMLLDHRRIAQRAVGRHHVARPQRHQPLQTLASQGARAAGRRREPRGTDARWANPWPPSPVKTTPSPSTSKPTSPPRMGRPQLHDAARGCRRESIRASPSNSMSVRAIATAPSMSAARAGQLPEQLHYPAALRGPCRVDVQLLADRAHDDRRFRKPPIHPSCARDVKVRRRYVQGGPTRSEPARDIREDCAVPGGPNPLSMTQRAPCCPRRSPRWTAPRAVPGARPHT